MLWKKMPKEKLLEMLKDETVHERTKFRICEFLGISKKKTEKSGKEFAMTEPIKTKPKKDPYEYSTGKWV